MKRVFKTYRELPGFSLAEVLAALTISSMVLVAVLGIYGRAEHSASAVITKLDSSRLVYEVLQRMAEDLDEIITTSSGTEITLENKISTRGYQTAQLIIRKVFYDNQNQEKVFERVVWQASSDYDNDSAGLVLYRGHSGIGLEDKLLDEQKENWQRELFVPICSGVTFFKIQAVKADNFQDKWSSNSLPAAIVVTLSFAEPFKAVTGELDVTDSEKITRTIAIDRTRKIQFNIVRKDDKEQTNREQTNEEQTNKEQTNEEQKSN